MTAIHAILDLELARGLPGESEVHPRVMVGARSIVEDGVVNTLHIAVHESIDGH